LTALPKTEAKRARFDSFFATVGTIAMGSATYEWAVRNGDLLAPGRWGEEWVGRPAWIFSSRRLVTPDDPGLRVVAGDVATHHDDMVAAAQGRDVWIVGGGDLAAQFADAGLLDRVRVSVAPVTLGAGTPLFPRRMTGRLRLADVTTDGHFAFLDYAVGSKE
jgi:dihydrofolate reductase